MKKHQYLALVGTMFILAGLMVLLVPAMAQEEGEEPTASVPAEPEVLTEFWEQWVESPHADVTSESFNHWNEDDPAVIPASCATCHATSGYLDYLGEDGSDFREVDEDHPIGQVVTCDACHNETVINLESVVFPAGIEIGVENASARCMICHQGRASQVQVVSSLEESGAFDDMNAVNDGLSFINIHYYAAASSLYGAEVNPGYEFDGMRYEMRYNHVEGYNTCADCHDPHTLELDVDSCESCHDADDIDEIREIRMQGSLIDYDGDGDIEEGIYYELETLREMLLEGIQQYATEVVGTPIAYGTDAYPYWFVDTDDDGEAGDEEANYGNRYTAFTGNLLIATYNYQVAYKDPGAYAHNAKYHIELVYDTIDLLNTELSEPIELAEANRDDPGHFDSTSEAWRHWDEDGEVSGRCSKCHTGTGLPFYFEHGVNIAMEPTNAMECSTCHTDIANIEEGELYLDPEVVFPSGAVVSFGEEDASNMCLECHQGRQSTQDVMAHIAAAGVGDDEVSEDLSFRNPHYFAAGATLFGDETQGGYQYEGMEYTGRFIHHRRVNTCISCHEPHALTLDVERCADCHLVDVEEDIPTIRLDDAGEPVDYDGDGDVEEPVRDEMMTLTNALFDEIMAYAEAQGAPIVYNGDRYPYWFTEDGERYASWTPTLVRAVYNYTWAGSDPGGYAHNADYIMQLVYDSLVDIGGEAAVADFTRPPIVVIE